MRRPLLVLTASAVVLAGGVLAASAQQRPGGPMMQGPGGNMMQGGAGPMMQDREQPQAAPQSPGQQSGRMPRRDSDDDDDREARGPMMGRGHGSGHHGGMMGGMMGRSGMAGMGGMSPQMMRLALILMDGDGDGALSWEEFRTGHERIFKAMDVNKDGRVTLEEMQGFMQPPGSASRQPAR